MHVTFSQDGAHCVVTEGCTFTVFSCDTRFEQKLCRSMTQGKLRNVSMFESSNIFVFVTRLTGTSYSVSVWDDHAGRVIGEILFKTLVHRVVLTRFHVIVVAPHKIYVHSLARLLRVETLETGLNPDGLLSLANGLSFGNEQEELLGLQWATTANSEGFLSIRGRQSSHDFRAHDTALVAVEMSPSGRVVASASEQGTTICVWDSKTGQLLHSLRRGRDMARITGLSFNPEATRLLCTSTKGTLHIFETPVATSASSSWVEWLQEAFSTFVPVWSSAQFRHAEKKLTMTAHFRDATHIDVVSAAQEPEEKRGLLYTVLCLTANHLVTLSQQETTLPSQ